MKAKKPKKPKVWLFPVMAEREYVRTLSQLTDKVLEEVELFCKAQEKNYRLHQDGLFDWIERAFRELLTLLLFHVQEHKIKQMVKRSFDEANQFNKKQFHKMLKHAYGVDIFTAEAGLKDKLALFELQNVDLIKSIPTQLHEKLKFKFVDAVQKGKRWETLVDEVQELGQITRNRAKLIAQDQIGKLNGQLTKIRQEEIGVKKYIWRTSLDERVRKLHVHREGETFDWANPPDDGHPGEPIRCRCYAEAVLPSLDELVAQKQAVAVGGGNKESILPEVDQNTVLRQNITTFNQQEKRQMRSEWADDFPDTIIDRKLGDATSHRLYEKAKKVVLKMRTNLQKI